MSSSPASSGSWPLGRPLRTLAVPRLRIQLSGSDLHITAVGFRAWAIGGGTWRYGWGDQAAELPIAAIHRALEGLSFCRGPGIGVIAYSPMASGMLTGAMTKERAAQLPANGDNSLGDAATQVGRSIDDELFQNDRPDILRRIVFAVDFDSIR